MSREPLPPRPEKESFDVSEAPREPSGTDGLERRAPDRTVDGTSPLQRALAGLTTAGEWAAQAEAEERATAQTREQALGTEAVEIDDLEPETVHDDDATAEALEEPETPSPRDRARRRKLEAREARRAEKAARREARRTARQAPASEDRQDVEDAKPASESATDVEAQDAPESVTSQTEPTDDVHLVGDDLSGSSAPRLAEPRSDARAHRRAAKHARRAAALERRQVRLQAKARRGGRRADDVDPAATEPAESAREPDEIDRELVDDDVTSELAAVASTLEAEERLEAEGSELDRLGAERLEAERLAAEQLIAEELAAERLAAEQAEIERLEAERLVAEQAEFERLEAERIAAATALTDTPVAEEQVSEEPEIDWEDVERRAAEAAVAVSARAAAREQKASDRQRKIEAKAAARLEKDRARRGSVDDVPEPPDEATGAGGASPLTIVAAVVGAAGLILSVVLAVGAMLAALGTDSGALYDVVSTICDALTAPLGGIVDFSGSNAAQKEALVAWGLGSIVYLAIGLGAQSLLRSRTDDV